MYVSIKGSNNGTYSNKGTSSNLATYLEHEDFERALNNEEIEPFFSLERENVSKKEVIESIDNNKKNLGKDDVKFFCIEINPSKDEIEKMGKNEKERSEKFKEYIRNDVMREYADNFKKELKERDLMFYGKIHHKRDKKEGMHAHIIVSRKTIDNKIKINPNTNHRNTSKGKVMGGFDRNIFYLKVEKSFDKKFSYSRKLEDTFEYKNAFKKQNITEILKLENQNKLKESLEKIKKKELTNKIKNKLK